MKIGQRKPKYTFFVLWSFMLCLISFSYSNCASFGDRASGLYFGESAKPTDQGQNVPPNSVRYQINGACKDSLKYRCDHRIFYPEAKPRSGDMQYPCTKVLSSNIKICAKGHEYLVNSTDLDDKASNYCSENPLDCNSEGGSFEDYHCFFDLPDSKGAYQIQAHAPNLKESLSAVFLSCVESAQRSQGSFF